MALHCCCDIFWFLFSSFFAVFVSDCFVCFCCSQFYKTYGNPDVVDLTNERVQTTCQKYGHFSTFFCCLFAFCLP